VRLLTGFPHGTYFGVAALVAASPVARERRAQAVGLVMLGLTVATLVGVPIAAGIGTWLGWRAAFVIVGAIGALTVLLVWRWVPFVPADVTPAPARTVRAGAQAGVVHARYWRDRLWRHVRGVQLRQADDARSGAYARQRYSHRAGAVRRRHGGGNLAGAKLADKALMPTVGGVLVWSALVLGAFVFTAPYPWLASLNVMLVGTAVALGPPLQIRLMDVAGDAQTLAAALNHSAFNLANALGAWLGGITIAAGLG
jgi:DHA1 family inner membrane transport protein